MSAKYRIAISALLLVGFCASIDLYLWRFDHDCLPIQQMRLWYNLTLGIFFGYTLIDEICGYKSYLHQQYNLICKLSILLNIICVILTHMNLTDTLYQRWIMFNGSVVATVIIITSSCFRYGTFSNNDY